MEKRANIIVFGKVQRCGYRDAVEEIAKELGVVGFVENLPDDTVKIVCEGEEKVIREFVKKIKIDQYPIVVEKVDVKFEPAKGEFKDFKIVRGDPQIEMAERADEAAKYMRKMFCEMRATRMEVKATREELSGKQDKMLEKQDKMLEKQDIMIGKQDKTLAAIGKMNADMNKRFDTMIERMDRRFDEMARRYDKISKSLDIGIRQLLVQSARTERAVRSLEAFVRSVVKKLK